MIMSYVQNSPSSLVYANYDQLLPLYSFHVGIILLFWEFVHDRINKRGSVVKLDSLTEDMHKGYYALVVKNGHVFTCLTMLHICFLAKSSFRSVVSIAR